jgi:hypothetical protein
MLTSPSILAEAPFLLLSAKEFPQHHGAAFWADGFTLASGHLMSHYEQDSDILDISDLAVFRS